MILCVLSLELAAQSTRATSGLRRLIKLNLQTTPDWIAARGVGPRHYDEAADARRYVEKGKSEALALLRQAAKTIEEEIEFGAPSSPTAIESNAPPQFSRKVFIVHGRDDGPREAVARFLERLGFEAVILHEQANQSRTVIEKVEGYSDVGFAVVLLTPDDEGNLKGEVPHPRARQNVLLELGYFIGKLTRARVCTLKVGDLEIPSDWRGVVDEPFDEFGGWKRKLALELQAASYEVDWNKVMRP
jgi:predicted nucleotide-binding protein